MKFARVGLLLGGPPCLAQGGSVITGTILYSFNYITLNLNTVTAYPSKKQVKTALTLEPLFLGIDGNIILLNSVIGEAVLIPVVQGVTGAGLIPFQTVGLQCVVGTLPERV